MSFGKVALVTNALDFVGPPAVAALLESGFKVAVHDPGFTDPAAREDYAAGTGSDLDPPAARGGRASEKNSSRTLGQSCRISRP